MIKLNKRYELKVGKFGYYFYDSKVEVDLTLNMLLDKLNFNDNRINKFIQSNNILNKDIFNLKDDIIELRNRLRIYEKL